MAGLRPMPLVVAALVLVATSSTACEPTLGDGSVREVPVSAGCDELLAPIEVAEEHVPDEYPYDRAVFGDYPRDALLRDSLDVHGSYLSEYDGREYDHASEVHVDHTVALAEAWESGAWRWSDETLQQFGGDARNLTLLTDEVNVEKGASDPAEWLPPSQSAWPGYLERWVTVKSIYDLAVDEAELDALYFVCLNMR